MSHVDLREWLEAVRSRGELECISGADWNLEMSSIVELVYRHGKDPKPALLFDEIPGYPRGYRTLFGMLGSLWRISKTLGLPVDGGEINRMRVHQHWYDKAKTIKPVPPQVVSSGPVLENTATEGQIDVLKFPAPFFHEHDRCRYLGTGHAVIQKDPDTGCVNLGAYRIMVVDRNRLAIHAGRGQHGDIIMNKYFARGQTVPVVIAAGLDPVLWWVSCQKETPWGASEYDRAGGIKGEPIEVIEGAHTGLPFPARAEIVIEGEIHAGEVVDEGPFGEWHGYYANRGLETVPEPIIRVKAIHHRNNPILTCSQMAVPPNTLNLMVSVADSVAIRRRLEEYGIPGVKGVWTYYGGTGGLFNVISIEQAYTGHGRQAGLLASQYPSGMGAYTVVVEEDIDPSNLEQVVWAMVTRAQPDRSIQILPYCHGANCNPAIPLSEKKNGDKDRLLTAARVVIDGCRDYTWKEDWYPMARLSPGMRANIQEKWLSVFSRLI
ncbi:MAG: UbiD family decarboxylase [Chloroflexi bacterium]|nr:UbiD family decarboxylase [Chloroflexota bacterium]